MKIIPSSVRRVLKKGPRVILSRAAQAIVLLILRQTGFWPRFDRRINAFWSGIRVGQWTRLVRGDQLLIGVAKLRAFRSWAQAQPDWRSQTEVLATHIRQGNIQMFDQNYSLDPDRLPWHTDWRFSHTWPPCYYHDFGFYEVEKPVPYDVKFPWELSRMSFLLPVAQVAAMGVEGDWRDWILSTISDWHQQNPVAFSVNWYPMEVSMRSINLVLLTQILAADSATTANDLAPLLRQLTLHGEFLFKTIEYTDVRGNHYAANMTALLLLGTTLRDVYRPAGRWARHAAQVINQEIELQYCADGVNFEKSTAYHRLVTELFLIALIEMERAGFPVSQVARERLHQACEYTWSYMRPDGLAPNWGDNDSARALNFDDAPVRNHGALLSLAGAYFQDEKFKQAAPQESASIAWLLGEAGLHRWKTLDAVGVEKSRFFSAGGIVVSRSGGNFLFADFGEVGQKGLGGHGHNDTFGFELCLDGVPIIIDSGCPVYTGDLAAFKRFRGTQSHNVLRVDGEEMAPLLGTWRISNQATSRNVRFDAHDDFDSIQGEHHGYVRLSDPVIHQRTLTFYKSTGKLVGIDQLRCAGRHKVELFFHFSPHVQSSLREDCVTIEGVPERTVVMRWSPGAGCELVDAEVSDNYGHKAIGRQLTLTYEIVGDVELNFEIGLESCGG